MCGIAGLVDYSPRRSFADDLREMAARAAHRGPDDGGLALFGPGGAMAELQAQGGGSAGPWTVGLGHRRLSIIDLSPAGHQPMSDASGRYWIVFNGEVYNHVELRAELERTGRTFRSRTDTEVVLHAYLEWGADCLARFNGMWAFAIYDRTEERLFCARDRFGVKPFYFAAGPGRFAFASEIKQLLAVPWVESHANRAVLADFFFWGLETHTDETFFAGIRCLPAAHCFLLAKEDLERGRFEPRRYWEPVPGEALDERPAVEAFRDLMSDAVRLRLRSDVPVGVTLSGGLDSSSVACLAGAHRRAEPDAPPLDAFNVEFAGVEYSERRFAEAAARQAGARAVVLHPGQEDLARDWTRFVWHMEEPFGSLSYFSNYQIYRLIREHGISVVLSGQGGDELLLGYEQYRTFNLQFELRAFHPWAAWKEILAARRHANLPLSVQAAHLAYNSLPFLRAARRRRLVRPWLHPDFFAEFAGATDHLRRSMLHADRVALQRSESSRYKLPHLLRHEDRVSMAHSIESRLPFLDYRLWELVLGQPVGLLFRDGWSKYVLRRAMDGILPAEVQNRTDKMGYETPTGRLLRRNGTAFQALLERHRDDAVLNVPALVRDFGSEALDERLLCAALSYLSWKEAFGAA